MPEEPSFADRGSLAGPRHERVRLRCPHGFNPARRTHPGVFRWHRVWRRTSTTEGHAERIDAEAATMAQTGDYETIFLQRSWRTATGRVGTSGDIPDIIGVRRTGTVDAFEVRSRSQTDAELTAKLNRGMSSLPSERQGIVGVLEPLPRRPR
jgi:hypothetical protein